MVVKRAVPDRGQYGKTMATREPRPAAESISKRPPIARIRLWNGLNSPNRAVAGSREVTVLVKSYSLVLDCNSEFIVSQSQQKSWLHGFEDVLDDIEQQFTD